MRVEAHGGRPGHTQCADPESRVGGKLYRTHDGSKLGVERIAASLENGITRLAQVMDDVDAARSQLLGA